MPISALCPECGKSFKTADKYAGKKIRCPDCGGVIALPAAPVQIVIRDSSGAKSGASRPIVVPVPQAKRQDPEPDPKPDPKPKPAPKPTAKPKKTTQARPAKRTAQRPAKRRAAREEPADEFDEYDYFESEPARPARRERAPRAAGRGRGRSSKSRPRSTQTSPLLYAVGGGGVVALLGILAFGVWSFWGGSDDTDGSAQNNQALADASDNADSRADQTDNDRQETAAEQTPRSGPVVAFKKVQNSVVQLQSLASSGTGILLNDQGLILTNAHVVVVPLPFKCMVDVEEGGQSQTLTYSNVQILGVHPLKDLALVRIDPSEHSAALSPAKISWKKAQAGQQVFAIGNPGADENVSLTKTITEGLVSGVDRLLDGVGYYQISAAINPGNSGGPLTNEFGDVLGVVTLRLEGVSSVGFAIPLHDLDLSDFVPPRKRRTDARECERLVEVGRKQQTRYYELDAKGRSDSLAGQLAFVISLETYQRALLSDPTNWKPYLFIGRLLSSQDDFDGANAFLGQSLQIDPWNYISAYEALGQNLLEAGREADAMTVWREGVARFPQSGEVIWEKLASAHRKRREYLDCGLCATAGSYSNFKKSGAVKNQLILSHMVFADQNVAAADKQLLADASVVMDKVAAKLNAVAKSHAEKKTPAMREDFSKLAKQLSIQLDMRKRTTNSSSMRLVNSMLQFPPPGVQYQGRGLGAVNKGRSAASDNTAEQTVFPVASNTNVYNGELKAAIKSVVNDIPADTLSKLRQQFADSKKKRLAAGRRRATSLPPPSTGSTPKSPAAKLPPVKTVDVVTSKPILKAVSTVAPSGLSDILMSPNGQYVIAKSSVGPVQIWDRKGALTWTQFPGHDNCSTLCAISRDGTSAMTSGRKTLIWNLETMEIDQSLQLRAGAGAFSKDLSRVALNTSSGITIFSTKNGQELTKLDPPGVPKTIGLKDDDRTLTIITSGHDLMVYDAMEGQKSKWKIEGDGFAKGEIAADADLAVVQHIKRATIVDTSTGDIVFLYTPKDSFKSCSVSADGKSVAFIHSQAVRILNLSDRDKPRWLVVPLAKYIYHGPDITLSKNGSLLACNPSDSKTVEVWDVKAMWKAAK